MKTYDKIQTVYKRDLEAKGKSKPIIEEAYTTPEIEYLKDNIWYGTEKVDGTNTRIQWNGASVEYKGKTDDAQYFPGMLQMLQELLSVDKLKEVFPKEDVEVCLYGETYGNKIQSCGKYYSSAGVKFILFDIKIGDWWLKRSDIEDIAKKLEIDIVPVVFSGTIEEAIKYVKEGRRSLIAESALIMEGLILQPEVPMYDRKGERIITKIKYRDFK